MLQAEVSRLRRDAQERASKAKRALTPEDEEQINEAAVERLEAQLTVDPSLPRGDVERAERARQNMGALQALMRDFQVANEGE